MAAPITGQTTAQGLTTPQALSSTPINASAFIIKAPLTNSAAVFIGPSTITGSTGHQMDPGDIFSYERQIQNGMPFYEMRVSDFYMVGTNPDIVTWVAAS